MGQRNPALVATSGSQPPSTLAAQILQSKANSSTIKDTSRTLNFDKLLQDFLNDPVVGTGPEKIQENARFITSLCDAASEHCQHHEPFSPNHGKQQAIDCLRAIQLTIDRHPDVLFYDEQHSTGETTPPLILWITTSLLSIAAKNINLELCLALVHVFCQIRQSLARKPDFVDKNIAYDLLIQKNLKSMIGSLEELSSSYEELKNSFSLSFPSLDTMPFFWQSVQNTVALPPGYQLIVNKPNNICNVVITLLTFNALMTDDEKFLHNVTNDFYDLTTDTLQLLQRLDQCYFKLIDYRCLDRRKIISHQAYILSKLPSVNSNQYLLQHWRDSVANIISIFRHNDDESIQIDIAKCLIYAHKGSSTKFHLDTSNDSLNQTLLALIKNNNLYSGLLPDLKNALKLYFMIYRENNLLPQDLDGFLNMSSFEQAQPFTSLILQETFNSEIFSEISIFSKRTEEHTRKKPKFDNPVLLEDKKASILLYIRDCLSQRDSSNFVPLQTIDMNTFSQTDSKELLDFLKFAKFVPCEQALSLENTSTSNIKHCCKCDRLINGSTIPIGNIWRNKPDEFSVDIFYNFLCKLSDTEPIKNSKVIRIELMQCIYRMVNHIDNEEYTNLKLTLLGQNCIKSFQSSSREVRICASRSILSYLRDDLPDSVMEANRQTAVTLLRMLSQKDNIILRETVINLWSLIGQTCSEKELNLSLLQLVDELGHSHPIICGTSFHEIDKIAKVRGLHPLALFQPFWRSIAPGVVRDIFRKPQKCRQLAELLEMRGGIDELLVSTQIDTVPFLVVTKEHDVLERIAMARKFESVQALIMDTNRMLGAVLARVLLESPDSQRRAESLLQETIPNVQGRFPETLNVQPNMTAWELLKAVTETEEARVRSAFDLLAQLTNIFFDQQNMTHDSVIPDFILREGLAILSHSTGDIEHSRDRLPLAEKKRALKGIELFIKLSGVHVEVFLPQLRSVLQSAIEKPQMVNEAFSAWIELLHALNEEKIQSLIAPTFAIISYRWLNLDNSSKIIAVETIERLMYMHQDFVDDNLAFIPQLTGIEPLSSINQVIVKGKLKLELVTVLDAFIDRCLDDSVIVVRDSLQELLLYLEDNQDLIHENSMGPQPLAEIPQLYRTLLNVILRYKEHDHQLVDLCAQCLGVLGVIDPNKSDLLEEKPSLLLISGFDGQLDVLDFIFHLLSRILVESFKSAPNSRDQMYVAYVIQELLKLSGIKDALQNRGRGTPPRAALSRWETLPESIQNTLLPYLNTRYSISSTINPGPLAPFPKQGIPPNHGYWLREFVFHLLHKAYGKIAKPIFQVIAKVIRGHDISVASFMLPFVIQNIITEGDDQDFHLITDEINKILNFKHDDLTNEQWEDVKQCSENIFQVLDYLSRWRQIMKGHLLSYQSRSSKLPPGFNIDVDSTRFAKIDSLLGYVSHITIAKRAYQCKSYARAVLHYEEDINESNDDVDAQLKELQLIYEQIDEPDAIEGISTKLRTVDLSQQILDHKRSGRWTAALSYYEIAVQKDPKDVQANVNLLSCLKSSTSYDHLLNAVQSHPEPTPEYLSAIIPLATEAAWMTENFAVLPELMSKEGAKESHTFNAGLARAFIALKNSDIQKFNTEITIMRNMVSRSLSSSNTWSLSSAHPQLLQLHILYEIDMISRLWEKDWDEEYHMNVLNRRLDIMGSFTEDKQYVLGIRRAVIHLADENDIFPQPVATFWLQSSRLSRKANQISAAHDATTHAVMFEEPSAKIEHAKLLWKGGFTRKAIENVQAAIDDGSFLIQHQTLATDTLSRSTNAGTAVQNALVAKGQLLLAKWMDQAGQEESKTILERYQQVSKIHNAWDKGHYFLGSYYNKIYESEKAAPDAQKTPQYLNGECVKLIIDNYFRSMIFGPKYIYRTVPKFLTLWLDLAQEIAEHSKKPQSRSSGITNQYFKLKSKIIDDINKQVDKYILARIPPYVPYTAYAQILSRINNPHVKTARKLAEIIEKIAQHYPSQALWSLVAVSNSSVDDKKATARSILQDLGIKKNPDMKIIIQQADALTKCLLHVCQQPLDGKGYMSLIRDLHFRRSLDESYSLVVPIEKTLRATLPTTSGKSIMTRHKPFPKHVTVAGFLEEVLVLSSLQRPRKLIMRGSDGLQYPILCKPKDDLRKDQRLMEFNAVIDRALKQDVDASKRKLYIKTYAVTTLNDEHGVLEWVNGLRPLRDIILQYFNSSNIRLDFGFLKTTLESASRNPEQGFKIFVDTILPKYPPMLFKWFIELFPEPDAWFSARMRYTRSCGVMSLVGNALGLGDRHGENISLEQGTGGIFHVDFNCLFDKGLTFEKPERVPFRLTQNMVHAFGTYGVHGPFRTAAEITQRTLRANHETLMTIMEAFLHDPTTDFGLERRKRVVGVPDTPAEVLESVRRKFNCFPRGDTVPLSVEGYVDALIRAATDPRNLVQMYVGWCAFL